MNRNEVISFLNALEAKYPVEQWMIGDIYIWPLVKFDIFRKWRAKLNAEYNDLLDSTLESTNMMNRLIKSICSIFYVVKLSLFKKKQAQFLFVGANSHRTDFEQQFVNRYFQPIIEYLENDHHIESLSVDYKAEDLTKNYKQREKILFLDKYLDAIRLWNYFKNRNLVKNLSEFDLFVEDVNIQFPELRLSSSYLDSISKRVKLIMDYGSLFNLFFRKFSPEKIMCLCYYNNICYGLNYAANKSNIISIDMQHGGQGPTHPAYADFNKVPAGGYNLLPRLFWCWDISSMKSIQSWSNKQNDHQVLLGGNPWLSYFLNNSKSTYEFPAKKIILYSLQLNEPENYIIQAIKDTPVEYQWWLRLHPRTLSTIGHIENLLTKAGIGHMVELQKATYYPLPQILLEAVIHISRSSGSVIEAAQLGVKSIIIHEIGVENYAEYIENGEAISFLDESSDQLIKLIMKNESQKVNIGQTARYKNIIENLMDK